MTINQNRWISAEFVVRNGGETPFQIIVTGRERWALECLMSAGRTGCTSIETPGPRWSAYVFGLRRMGLDIETVTEPNTGPFAGTHARYVLRSHVERAQGGEVAA